MKTNYSSLLVLFVFALSLLSCRTEEDLTINPPSEQGIEANSVVANLLKRTAKKDGSFDNIIDKASCLSIELPVSLTVNGVNLTINSIENYDEVEDILDLFRDDVDNIEIDYPITVITEDFSSITVNSDQELGQLAATCSGENEDDDDIECIDIQYPITASVFNERNEVVSTLTLTTDKDLYDFIDDLDEYVAASLNFPITVVLADGMEMDVSSIAALEAILDDAKDSCDEDDDYDYNDDDCDNCSPDQLTELFDTCNDFHSDGLELNDEDYEDDYEGYSFNFGTDNIITVTNASTTYSGTWEATGSGNAIDFVIDIPDLPQVSGSWRLNEIEQESEEAKFELRRGDDELEFESDCKSSGGNGSSVLATILLEGKWVVASYTEDSDDQTSDYAGFELDFIESGSVTASNGSVTNQGTWGVNNASTSVRLDFDSAEPFEELNEDDWEVVLYTENRVEIKDVSGDDESVDILVLEKI